MSAVDDSKLLDQLCKRTSAALEKYREPVQMAVSAALLQRADAGHRSASKSFLLSALREAKSIQSLSLPDDVLDELLDDELRALALDGFKYSVAFRTIYWMGSGET